MSAAAQVPPGAPCRALVVGDQVVAGPDWSTSQHVPQQHRNADPGKGTVTAANCCSASSGGKTCNGAVYCHIQASFPSIGFENYLAWGYQGKFAVKLAVTKLEGAAKAALDAHGKTMGELFENPQFSDVKIVCGGKTFNVNKCIIAAHSDVFKVMLKDEHLEGATNKIDVDDIEPDALRGLLYFIYQGCMDPDTPASMATELFTAADKYNVQGLKDITEEYIINQFKGAIEPEEALRVLVVAHMHSNDKIKAAAIEYIGANPKKISGAANWDEFKKTQTDLAISLLEQVGGF